MTVQAPTWEYLHILSNPFAVVLTAAGAGVGLAGWIAGRRELERWGVVAALLGGVFAVPAYLTGLTAADVAATRTFVEPSAVQTHRIWATWATVVLAAQAVFAGICLWQEDERLRRFVLLVAAAGALLAGWTAYLGGTIIHGPEADRQRIEETAAGLPAPDRPSGEAGGAPPASGRYAPSSPDVTRRGTVTRVRSHSITKLAPPSSRGSSRMSIASTGSDVLPGVTVTDPRSCRRTSSSMGVPHRSTAPFTTTSHSSGPGIA